MLLPYGIYTHPVSMYLLARRRLAWFRGYSCFSSADSYGGRAPATTSRSRSRTIHLDLGRPRGGGSPVEAVRGPAGDTGWRAATDELTV